MQHRRRLRGGRGSVSQVGVEAAALSRRSVTKSATVRMGLGEVERLDPDTYSRLVGARPVNAANGDWTEASDKTELLSMEGIQSVVTNGGRRQIIRLGVKPQSVGYADQPVDLAIPPGRMIPAV